MPQVRPRLPNSSGGGLPPQVTIDDERWSQIKALIEPGLVGDHTGLKSEIERVTSKYLRFAGAAMSAPLLDRRGDQFNRLGRALGTVWHELEELQVGDEGDFATALIERSLSHPDLIPSEADLDDANAGDTVALKLCLDRVCPVQKNRPVRFELPLINSPRDAADIMVAVAKAAAAGDVTPNEAAEIGKVIDAYVKAYQTAERVARVEQLSDTELVRIALGGHRAETATPISRLLTVHSR